ncbi:MAG: succinate dehydrogenase iron-sulfur subunit [Anaerolineae bacterium]|jgi:succinate dehydrogenase / fumarate reductase iron-sulfur subunit|nr:succinate dehydrogenase iron-sulfur subunit [Anaerolineae bacterium]MBT4312258.1 succinate dehydrogenase iron-sulfur subunit [Anaerolineae bacterium]MBT6060413.1 succinate dehydrogenase iron-sulfur subunit [Anaerolineae bacterium]MBT6322007.1 succinate dehydrogenase iron-sulfur subunit [Anaerolineae bacterium]MBT6813334.1 succinate dehydrogenase iron-sulfur subunit [Anaerolineae bacterium]
MMKKITLKLFRYNPETDTKPHYDTYKLEVEPTDRVLDLLERIKGYEDGTLSFRRSCAHGVCGSCAMRVNGENKLACKTLMQDLSGNKVVVEPILGLPVKKDLIVDMEPFFINYKSVMPYFINNGSQPEKEHIQSIEEQERFDDTAKCILCGACTTSCPSFWSNDEYVGPAAIVNAHRFIFDSRDQGAAERLQILNDQFGVYRCRTIFNCTVACPREIEITKAIGEVKKAIASGNLE